MEVRVEDNPLAHRYEVRADGAIAGFTAYELNPASIEFIHTEIAKEFEGHGLGSALISQALDDARARGLAVLPRCPFVNAYIKRHPEYLDLVGEGERRRFGL